MRVLFKAQFDTEKGNEGIRSGKLPEVLKETLDRLKPEAAYFGPEDGHRTCWMVIDMKDSSEMPATPRRSSPSSTPRSRSRPS